jgi:hypothetical protein
VLPTFTILTVLTFRDLALCDPLLGRKHTVRCCPRIPDERVASVQVQVHKWKDVGVLEAFFAPSKYEDEDEESETLFRVIGIVDCMTNIEVFVFSLGSGLLGGIMDTSTTWADLSFESPQSTWAYYLFIRSTLFTETLVEVENCYSICMQNMKKVVEVDVAPRVTHSLISVISALIVH